MFLSLVTKRRSIRKYLEKPVEAEKIDILIETVLRSPSSRGLNPWEFVVVTDQGLLEKLSKAKPHGASFLKNAPMGLVVCADPEKCDVGVEDASIAATFLMLGAVDLGLGSCWIQIRERQKASKSSEEIVKEILNIPKKYRVEAIIALGYPVQDKITQKLKSFDMNKIYTNQFKKK